MGYSREYFYDAVAGTGRHPYDEELQVTGEMSDGVARLLVKLCTRLPYAEASAVFKELAQIDVSQSKAWWLTQEAGQYARPALNPQPTMKDTSAAATCIAISMDGCMVNVRGEGWKEVKIGTLSEVEASASETVKHNRHNEPIQAVHSVAHSYVLHLGGPEGFGFKLATEAQSRRWSHGHQSVVVADGAPWIWNLASRDYASAAHVVDWYHAKQHLAVAAELLFLDTADAHKAKTWTDTMADLLYDGQALQIAQRLDLAAALAKPGVKEKLVTEAGYFANNHERMQYRDFQKALLPIGSGTVESAAKQTKHRVTAAGMRWSRAGLENFLPLRAATMSGTFDLFWRSISPR